MSAYDGKPIAEIIDDYGRIRGDLSEQYARDQLVQIIEGRLSDVREQIAREFEAEASELSYTGDEQSMENYLAAAQFVRGAA